MKIVIVTGLSGAGKTQAIKAFEDLNYFCIDNMIPDLIPHFIEFANQMKKNIDKVALGIDIRGGDAFENLVNIIEKTTSPKVKYEILFLECKDEELLRRYKENRRQHPLAIQGRVVDGINLERTKLENIKAKAKYVIDTSEISVKKLKEKIITMFSKHGNKHLIINIVSFGFKYGIPNDADFVFDVRFIPNPFYIEELKTKTGKEKQVYDYVMKFDETKTFITNLSDLLLDMIPYFVKEGRNQIIIAIGCTGGQHRSVSIARKITKILQENKYTVMLEHRELEK